MCHGPTTYRGAVSSPRLADGLHIVVKQDCATCRLVAPLLDELAACQPVAVYTQDDATFPASPPARSDLDLEFSWRHGVETVPTVLRVVDGVEVQRTVGWDRAAWRAITGITGLGEALPEQRPGCGSLSVDPDRVDELRARFEGHRLRSRRVELADADDEVEVMFARGWTDGLPVVPPTERRVLAMLEGTDRAPDDVIAVVPPDLVEATVEKAAIAAVMAGCKPEYLPWVLTAIEAACNETFNMHGLLATTMPVGPVIICSGPGTRAIGMNAGVNALGQGNRANSTIGRALQLFIRNVGGGRPGEVDRATHGNPGKVSFCFAELDGSPFGSLAASRGVPEGVDALTLFPGEGPRCVVDQKSRSPESLAGSLADALRTVHSPKLLLAFDAVLVIGPEHARVFAEAGWDRARLLDELTARLTISADDVLEGADGIAEGMPSFLAGRELTKFRPGGLLIATAGGGAGLFSTIIGGWANGAVGSEPVTLEVAH